MIRIKHLLCTTGNICVAKENFPLTMVETDNNKPEFSRFDEPLIGALLTNLSVRQPAVRVMYCNCKNVLS